MATEQGERFREDSARFRLKVTRDEANDLVVAGRHGFLTPDRDENRLVYMPKNPSARKWGNRRRDAEAIGMVTRQNGDGEGIMGFDPARRDHWDLAISIVGARRKRVLSEEQKAILRERILAVRPVLDGPSAS